MNQEEQQSNESQRATNARRCGMVKKDQSWKMAYGFYKKVTGNNKGKSKCLITGWQGGGRQKSLYSYFKKLERKKKKTYSLVRGK